MFSVLNAVETKSFLIKWEGFHVKATSIEYGLIPDHVQVIKSGELKKKILYVVVHHGKFQA